VVTSKLANRKEVKNLLIQSPEKIISNYVNPVNPEILSKAVDRINKIYRIT